MQCGIACLQMVCEHFGKRYSAYEMAHHFHATSEGVSLHAIHEAALQLGFQATGGMTSINQLYHCTIISLFFIKSMPGINIFTSLIQAKGLEPV